MREGGTRIYGGRTIETTDDRALEMTVTVILRVDDVIPQGFMCVFRYCLWILKAEAHSKENLLPMALNKQNNVLRSIYIIHFCAKCTKKYHTIVTAAYSTMQETFSNGFLHRCAEKNRSDYWNTTVTTRRLSNKSLVLENARIGDTQEPDSKFEQSSLNAVYERTSIKSNVYLCGWPPQMFSEEM